MELFSLGIVPLIEKIYIFHNQTIQDLFSTTLKVIKGTGEKSKISSNKKLVSLAMISEIRALFFRSLSIFQTVFWFGPQTWGVSWF